LQNLLAWQ